MDYEKIFNNLILGILTTVLSTIGLVSIPYTIEKRRAFAIISFTPDLFPKIVFIIGIILGVLLILFHNYRSYFSKNMPEQPNETTKKPKAELKIVLPVLLFYLVCILLLNSLGYLVISFLFLSISMIYLGGTGKKNYFLIFSISIIFAFASYYFFRGFLGVTLPVGVWAPKIFY